MGADARENVTATEGRKQSDRPGRPQSALIDQTILKATLDVLADVGFDALSLAEVSRRAGASIPAIYRRHPGKLELVQAALKSELAELPVAGIDTGSLRKDLVGLAQRIAEALTERRARLFAGIVLTGRDNPELLGLVAGELYRIAANDWQDAISRAAARGEVLNYPAASGTIADLTGAYLLGRTLLDGHAPDIHHLEAMIDEIMLPALRSSPVADDRPESPAPASTPTPL